MVLCINLSAEFSGAAGNLKARFESMAKAGEEVMCKRERILLDISDTYVELAVDVEVAIILPHIHCLPVVYFVFFGFRRIESALKRRKHAVKRERSGNARQPRENKPR